MAIYSSLLLSAGGGIIADSQRAEQVDNTATVLIGLGGTGVDCIRNIKSQVYKRLKRDADSTEELPTYKHIRFLGVDSDDNKLSPSADNKNENTYHSLDPTEVFSIGNSQIGAVISNPNAINIRPELDWLRYDKIEVNSLSDKGAGGFRQVGRLMLLDKSDSFINKLTATINAAKLDLMNPTINVHIFAGISGGTGSGTFLDTCYMLQSLKSQIPNMNIFGYFFLPDVNLQRIPDTATAVRDFIPKNGYAAMQELDYCMNLQYNGGSFKQTIQGGRQVSWSCAPVDMCHLVCATNENAEVIPDAYDYAMNVVSEYIMDFLTNQGEESFTLTSHLANFRAMAASTNQSKKIGSNTTYCVIGASCAAIPLREINTYLASAIFEGFNKVLGDRKPIDTEVAKFAVKTLSSLGEKGDIEQLYKAIFDGELRSGVTDEYEIFDEKPNYIKLYGNKDMIQHYTTQTSAKKKIIATNAAGLVTQANNGSFYYRVKEELLGLAKDSHYGPSYAYGIVAAAVKNNLQNIVHGLIANNNGNWEQEQAQSQLRSDEYDRAKIEYDHHKNLFLGKAFDEYVFRTMCLEQHKYLLYCYEKMDNILKALLKQLDALSLYFQRMSEVFNNLSKTFKADASALNEGNIKKVGSSFIKSMVTIDDLKDTLDEKLEEIDIPTTLNVFINTFINNEGLWINGEENKIAPMVNDFFVARAFGTFANTTITDFLRTKYEKQAGGVHVNDAQLANNVYNDYIRPLTQKANPLFFFNQSIWSNSKLTMSATISYPTISGPIQGAVQTMQAANNTWQPKATKLTDRIFVMNLGIGLPISSYYNCGIYQDVYFSTNEGFGRHLYEEKGCDGIEFNDWRKLSPLYPYSLIDRKNVRTEQIFNFMDRVDRLYQQATEYKLFDKEGNLCEPDQQKVDEIKKYYQECKAKLESAKTVPDLSALQKDMEILQQRSNEVTLQPTKYSIPNDGLVEREDERRAIQKDHFAESPVIQMEVEKTVANYVQLRKNVTELCTSYSDKVNYIEQQSKQIDYYFDALSLGLFDISGRSVVYRYEDCGMDEEQVLCKFGDEYQDIEIYQAYVSYTQLSDEMKQKIAEDVKAKFKDSSFDKANPINDLAKYLNNDMMKHYQQLLMADFNKAEVISALKSLKVKFDASYARVCAMSANNVTN